MEKNYNRLKQQYSSDGSKQSIIYQDTFNLYSINIVLMLVYYILLSIYVYMIFSNVKNSPNIIKKIILLGILFLYPLIIYPIQHNIYNIVKQTINIFYSNIYISKDW